MAKKVSELRQFLSSYFHKISGVVVAIFQYCPVKSRGENANEEEGW